MTKTRYVVILEDDFVFTRTTELQAMFTTLENNPAVAVVGGGLEDKETVGTVESYGKDINVNNGGDVFFAFNRAVSGGVGVSISCITSSWRGQEAASVPVESQTQSGRARSVFHATLAAEPSCSGVHERKSVPQHDTVHKL